MGRVRATVTIALALALAACGGGAPAPTELGQPPKVCSTMAVNEGVSEMMEPGGDCVGCHAKGGAPELLVGGTVMAALHDDTNCNGVEGVTVRLTGADGQVLEMLTNRVGNFYKLAGTATLALPFKAQIIQGGKTAMMMTAQGVTNCGLCHTAQGTGLALGRIIPPAP